MKQADLAAYDRYRNLQLVAEVHGKRRAGENWARELRSNLLSCRAVPDSPYFLVALPDVFYLWTPATARDPQAAPEYTIDARQALAPYMRGWESALEDIHPLSLQMLVSSWLQDLASFERRREDTPASEWLFDSGLYEAIRGGQAEIDLAV